MPDGVKPTVVPVPEVPVNVIDVGASGLVTQGLTPVAVTVSVAVALPPDNDNATELAPVTVGVNWTYNGVDASVAVLYGTLTLEAQPPVPVVETLYCELDDETEILPGGVVRFRALTENVKVAETDPTFTFPIATDAGLTAI